MKVMIGMLMLAFIAFCGATLALPATKIIVYQAYTQSNALNPNLAVAQRYQGNCWRRSLANPARADAWRCQASDMTLDPCFEDTDSLACVATPWSTKTALLELEKPILKKNHRQVDVKTSQPWGLELANGQRCIFMTGASSVVHNMRVNYSCDSHSAGILGSVDRQSSVWSVSLYDYRTQKISKIPVTTAWF